MEIGCETSERVFSMKTFVSDYKKDLINQKKVCLHGNQFRNDVRHFTLTMLACQWITRALSVDKTLMVVVTQKVTLQPFAYTYRTDSKTFGNYGNSFNVLKMLNKSQVQQCLINN